VLLEKPCGRLLPIRRRCSLIIIIVKSERCRGPDGFSALDLFEFNAINLDVWTETYGVGYYLGYLMQWG
jgi:hypothetical protein